MIRKQQYVLPVILLCGKGHNQKTATTKTFNNLSLILSSVMSNILREDGYDSHEIKFEAKNGETRDRDTMP